MKYDIIIVGGGMVGASLACALHDLPLRIALIDAAAHPMIDDPRLIALTYGSCCLLKNLGIWPALSSHAAAIKQIHVSHKGHFGITRIHASDIQLHELGHLVPAKYINQALEEKMQSLKNIEIIRPAKLEGLIQNSDGVTLTVKTSTETFSLHAQTVIGADGTNSTVRELVNIKTKITDYHQSALVTVTELQRNHHDTAYERFLKDGAIAMLPLTKNTCATIWTDTNETISQLMQMHDTEFVSALQKEFGYRLGRFLKTQKRHTYPLKLVMAEENQKQNIMLIGNAAHTLHPIASQGLNLALYEIAELIDQLKQSSNSTLPFTNDTKKITFQQNISKQLSHRLPWLFSTDFFIVNFARQLGMLGLDSCKQAKEFFTRNAIMRRTGCVPRLLQEREYHETENIGH